MHSYDIAVAVAVATELCQEVLEDDMAEDVENGLPTPFPGQMRPPWPHDTEEASMTIRRMENVGVVVEDLEAAIAFFVEPGMELEGETTVDGQWAARISAASCSPSTTSRTSLPACVPTVPNSSAGWSKSRTAIGSATSAGPRGIIVALAEQLG